MIHKEKKALKQGGVKSIIYRSKIEVTFLLELLLNQWKRSRRKSSISKPDTSENRTVVLFAVLWVMWQGQPFINIFLFFANTRVIMEFFFPTLTAILSSPTATQFSQSTFFSLRMDLMLLKSASAVPSFHPPYLRTEQRLSLYYHQTNESKQDSIFLCSSFFLTHQYQVKRVHYPSVGWVQI